MNINIINTVRNLLYEHNCVIIPQFGGFIGDFKKPEFDESQKLVFPSIKKVAFNASLVSNDGLLLNAYKTNHNCSYEEAQNQIDLFVDEMKSHLQEQRNFEFTGVGTIYLTSDNTYLFIPYREQNFLMDSFGMGTLRLKKVNKEVVDGEEKTTPKTSRKQLKPEPVETERKEVQISQPTETKIAAKKQEAIRVPAQTIDLRKINIAAAVLIGFMAIGLMLPSTWYTSNTETAAMNFDLLDSLEEEKTPVNESIHRYNDEIKLHQKEEEDRKIYTIVVSEDVNSNGKFSERITHEGVTYLKVEQFFNRSLSQEYLSLIIAEMPSAKLVELNKK